MFSNMNPHADIWIVHSYIILLLILVGALLHFIYSKKNYFMFAMLYGIVLCFMFYHLCIVGNEGVVFPFIFSFFLLGVSFNIYILFPGSVFLFIDDKVSDLRKLNFYKGLMLFIILICTALLHYYLFLYKSPPSIPITQSQHSIGLDIDNGSMVWVTANGKRYHSNPRCSNMTNPEEISLSDAEDMGCAPCKKCY